MKNTIKQYITSYIVHKVFLCGNQNGRKPQNDLPTSKLFNTNYMEHPTPCLQAPTWRKIQLPKLSISNLDEATTP
jgi:hypothetical protein